MSLENILVPNNLYCYVNGVINGFDASANTAVYNSSVSGCYVSANAVTVYAALVSAPLADLVNIELKWALGSVTTVANAPLTVTSALPTTLRPAIIKSLYGQITLGTNLVPVYVIVNTDGTLTVNLSSTMGPIPSGQAFTFITINGCYTLSS